MYFPPYSLLLSAIGTDPATVKDEGQVTLPFKLFEFLMQAALATADFDEDTYLDANPDVKADLAQGGELNARQHYVGYGYFEGRKGGMPKVDERWYLRTYPDVADAVKNGQVASAAQHFEISGAAEGRAPARAYIEVADEWKNVLDVVG